MGEPLWPLRLRRVAYGRRSAGGVPEGEGGPARGDEGLRAVRHGRRVSWQLGRRRRGSPTPAGLGIASPSRVEARAARGAWWGAGTWKGGNSPARPVSDARALALSLIFSVPLRRVFARPAGEPTRDATARYKADAVVRRLPTSFPPFALSLQDLHWFVERPFSSPSFRPGVTPPFCRCHPVQPPCLLPLL